MLSLVARARIPLTAPERILPPLCEHLAEHGARISQRDATTIVTMGSRRASLAVNGDCLLAEVEAPDIDGLHELKQVLASHVIEFAQSDAAPVITWSGDGADLVTPPDFRVMTVVDVRNITPHMRRIRFKGEDLVRFDKDDALHVRLFLPPPDVEPTWPTLGENGLLRPNEHPLPVRKYTIRHIDVPRGELAIDFVLHGDAGPGTSFAQRARPGDRIGMAGPGGRGLRPADWHLFMGDETALPAIGRMLEMLPATARGKALIEISDPAEEQEIAAPAGIEIIWLHRNGLEPGRSTMLFDTLQSVQWPVNEDRIYMWGAMEHATFRKVRAFARERLHPDRSEHLIVSYWRRDAC